MLMNGLVHDAHPHPHSPCLKDLPSQLVDHVTDAGCGVIPSQDKVSVPVLYHPNVVSQDLCAGVLNSTMILCLWLDNGLVYNLPDLF